MLEPCTNLADSKAVKCCHLIGNTGLLAFIWVETALAKEVRAATNDIEVTCQEQRMRASTTNLDYIFIKHIKSVYSCWNPLNILLLTTQLSEVVATP